jgi:hypothetical protein
MQRVYTPAYGLQDHAIIIGAVTIVVDGISAVAMSHTDSSRETPYDAGGRSTVCDNDRITGTAIAMQIGFIDAGHQWLSDEKIIFDQLGRTS